MRLFKKSSGWLLVCSLLFILSCTKTGSLVKPDLLPGAMVYIGGSDQLINIPEAKGRNATYEIDQLNQQVIVNLVVGRSGFQEKEGFTAEVVVSNDSVSNLISSGKLDNVILLNSSMYILDETVNVQPKTDGGVIQLKLNMKEIGDIGKKRLALGIKIQNPSKYTVNPKFEQAILLIDYRAIVGIACQPDVDAEGRIFFDFQNEGSLEPWFGGGVDFKFIGPGKVQAVRNNNDGYGLAVLRDNAYTYNLGTHPVVAIRVYETPTEGAWWVRFYDGTKDHDLQPADAIVKPVSDGSKIYYWNMPQRTGLTGVQKTNVMTVVIGARGQSLTFGWIKSYEEEVVVDQCINN